MIVTPNFLTRGQYNPDYKGEDTSACLPCTAGYYCPQEGWTDPLQCMKGNYSASSATACTTCDAGRYCNQNTTTQGYMNSDLICPAGVECPPGMDRVPDLVQDRCRQGHYCPRGDISRYPVACPNGTFNGQYGLIQVWNNRLIDLMQV